MGPLYELLKVATLLFLILSCFVSDNFYWIATKPTHQYMYGFFSAIRPYFSFEVTACSDVYLLLHDSTDNTQGTRYEVCRAVAGGDFNDRTICQSVVIQRDLGYIRG